MNSHQGNSNRKGNGKCWRFEICHCEKSEVSATTSDTIFFTSLFPRTISESVNPSESYPETPTWSRPLTRSTSSSCRSASVPAFLQHTSLPSAVPSGPPTGLSAPLSLHQLFPQGHQNWKGRQQLKQLIQFPLELNWCLQAGWNFFSTILENKFEERG